MTLPKLLSDIAYTGNRGLNPQTLKSGQEWDVKHLIELDLVHTDLAGWLVASTEKGKYPVVNSLGKRTDPRSERVQ